MDAISNALRRMRQAILLEESLYKEVAADRQALSQAFLVVVLVAVATGLGAFRDEGAIGLVTWIVMSLIGWVVWTSLSYVIGGRLLATPHTAPHWGQMFRALGFAQAPGVLRLLAIIPAIGVVIAVVSFLWQFIAMIVAVRQVLGYSSYWRAITVMILAFIPYLLVQILIGFLLLPRTS